MSFKRHRCVTIACDVCSRAFTFGDDLTAHFDTEADAISAALDAEWRTDTQGRIACEDCLYDIDVYLDAVAPVTTPVLTEHGWRSRRLEEILPPPPATEAPRATRDGSEA